MDKYYCKLCKYSTNKLSNFNKHKLTKKHIKLGVSREVTQKDVNRTVCEYCGISISAKKYLKRHYRRCKKYEKCLIERKKNGIIEKLSNKNNHNMKEIETLKNKLNKSLNDVLHKDEIVYNLVAKLNNVTDKYNKLTNNKTTKRIRKQKIPATVRNTIWKLHNKNKTASKCYCCRVEPVTKGNFECGHIISNKDGGKIKLDNLKPICGLCNKSMGTMNMIEFMKQYGYNTN